jgi:hypothetical protein
VVDVADAIASLPKDFWDRVDKDGPIPPGCPERGPCWPWRGRIDPQTGYGDRISIGGGEREFPHRIAYRALVGPIPNLPPDDPDFRLEIDHLCHSTHPTCRDGTRCHHRRCVNPDHMEIVTHGENIARRRSPDACPVGHPYSEENAYISPAGNRYCRTCNRDKQREFHAKRKQAGALPPPDARCKRGHPYAVDSSGRWYCRECHRERARAYKRRKREERAASATPPDTL